VSLIGLLNQLFVQPLMLVYGAVFAWLQGWTPNSGWALITFGILLNLGLTPIYYQMEAAGREGTRNLDAMNAEIARMKAHYRGRERFYYVRTVRRVFGYRPISAVYRSGDLFLQVLVFATVYRFLSGHQHLAGTRFWVIPDLARPDGILWGVNLLPLLMTVFNVASALLYGRDRPTRRNAFLLAGVFLVLLYASPSGLVLYWTTNNAFSLVRNLVQRKLTPLLPAGLTAALSRVAAQV
jgi:membrane protein insertase Oxa1/YidC/SpoIIIJ